MPTPAIETYELTRNYGEKKTGRFGLGLAIAQAVIQAHGGSIMVHSKVGHGTTFGVSLPVNLTVQAGPPD